MRAPLLLLAVAGCASLGGSAQQELARERAGLTAGPARNCISASQSQSLQAVDRQTIVLRSAGTVWVSRLGADCPGLSPTSTLVVERNSGQYCRHDRVTPIEPGSAVAGASCALAEFVPYRRP